jgi:hypothetical protein
MVPQLSRKLSWAPARPVFQKTAVQTGDGNYSRFSGTIEAQSLCAVLP